VRKRCPKCCEWLPRSAFYASRAERDGLASYCKKCTARYTAVWQAAHPDRYAHLGRRWRLWNNYGVSLDGYRQMLTDQGGRCAVCGTTDPGRQYDNWAVDHDHQTGRVRGLLCRACNTALGLLGDDPDRLRRAALYLESSADYRSRLQLFGPP
jgi:hypothetical protein